MEALILAISPHETKCLGRQSGIHFFHLHLTRFSLLRWLFPILGTQSQLPFLVYLFLTAFLFVATSKHVGQFYGLYPQLLDFFF